MLRLKSETSMMLAIEEETVKKDEMMKNDYVPDCPREYLNYSSLLKLSKTGVWGYPSLATKETGEKLIEKYIEVALKYIDHAFKHTEKDRW